MTPKPNQVDRQAAGPFMDRYLDGSSFCDDRDDLAQAFASHRIQACGELIDMLESVVTAIDWECPPIIDGVEIEDRARILLDYSNEARDMLAKHRESQSDE